jgi:hypothetical protein
MKYLHATGNNKFELIKYKEYNLQAKDSPYVVEYQFKIPDYIVTVDNDIYINLNMENPIASLKLENDRKAPFELEFLSAFEIVMDLEIPAGYTIKNMPPNASYHEPSSDRFGYDFSYTIKDNHIALTQKIYFNFLMLNKIDFQEFNNFTNQISKSYKETLVITKE